MRKNLGSPLIAKICSHLVSFGSYFLPSYKDWNYDCRGPLGESFKMMQIVALVLPHFDWEEVTDSIHWKIKPQLNEIVVLPCIVMLWLIKCLSRIQWYATQTSSGASWNFAIRPKLVAPVGEWRNFTIFSFRNQEIQFWTSKKMKKFLRCFLLFLAFSLLRIFSFMS